jgi:phosphate transport system protein
MSRQLFNKELTDLHDAVLVMGSMVEKALLDSMESLRKGDVQWSKKIIDDDDVINAKRFQIEDRCLFVIASQQPMATDLRNLASILFIVTDLERIADHAEGIARINLLMGDEPLPRRLDHVPTMAELAVTMLRDTLQAYIDQDVDAARRICDADDEIDRLQDRVYEESFRAMISDPSTIQRNTYMLWTAHNLERVGDRCTNICERIIYAVTGRMEEINISKY